ncbi:MAG TPA: sugar transferase [Terriglobales bacterium]|nr:sugar transferase [Terriglobales bacterium]
MLRERAQLLSRGLAALDLTMVTLAYFYSLALRHGASNLRQSRAEQIVLLLSTASFLFWLQIIGGYRSLRRGALLGETGLVVKAAVATGLTLPVLCQFVPDAEPQRPELWLFLAVAFVMVSGARLAVRTILRSLRSRGFNLRFYLVAGGGTRAEEIAQAVTAQAAWGIRVIGYLDGASDPEDRVLTFPNLGTLERLEEILETQVVDGVFLVATALPPAGLRQALECCRRFGIQAFVDLHPFEELCGHLSVSEFAHSPLLSIAHTNLGEQHALFKRAFDFLLALAGSILLSPLLLLIAALIKIFSPGPVLFRQARVGRNGRLFTMLKFRSMMVDAEKMQSAIAAQNEMSGPVFKMLHDPRVSSIGRYLRMWSLDELPQLWNVLCGDMSLVGPRPPLPGEVGQYQSWHHRRLSMRPGLTCLWQVSGRNRIDFDAWMKLDLEYIDHWSWWLDVKILFRTLPAMLRGQ